MRAKDIKQVVNSTAGYKFSGSAARKAVSSLGEMKGRDEPPSRWQSYNPMISRLIRHKLKSRLNTTETTALKSKTLGQTIRSVVSASSVRRISALLIALTLISSLSGCVYFNTFYNARKNFNEAESERKNSLAKGGKPRVNRSKYKIAIEKSSVVLEKHPDSKYYDDALYMIGVSYYWTTEYLKSQRKFRELLANFEESDYTIRSRLYLAKCKLALDERAEAIIIFQNLLETVDDDKIRTEAAFAIGDFYFDATEYEKANIYYEALIDSLASTDVGRRKGRLRVAEGYFARFSIPAAKDNFLAVLDMNPTLEEEYVANFRAGECSYLLQDIIGGLERFELLADDTRFYDSIGSVRLQIARGYELDDDMELALEEYENISVESEASPAAGAALYNLGLIYQFDLEDFDKSLEYYEQAKKKGRTRNPFYDESVRRAADIAKLATFKEGTALDTAATQEQIDQAAQAQLRLGELFLFDLNQPDSAVSAFQYAIDSLPNAYYTPRALLSLALTQRDYLEDTTSYDSLMQEFLVRYPKSDYYADALEILGLVGTEADTGYAGSYFAKAEHWLIEESNLDSAMKYYEFVADSFPQSKVSTKARFTLIWLDDKYNEQETDSTIYFAYGDLADLYPNDDYGKLAGQISSYSPKQQIAPTANGDSATFADLDQDSLELAAAVRESQESFVSVDTSLSQELRFYVREGRQLRDAQSRPRANNPLDFIYPVSAASQPDFFDLYFQVQIDFDGLVMDSKLMNPTQFSELNRLIKEQVDNFVFSSSKWGDLGRGDGWFVYKYRVTKPEYLR